MATKLVSWNDRSASASLLARTLNVRRIINDSARSRYRWSPGDTLINWGLRSFPAHIMQANFIPHRHSVINAPNCVGLAQDKLLTFNSLNLQEHLTQHVPSYTNVRSTAESWLEDGTKVVARRLLRSYGGRGITIASTPEELPDAALYVKYIPKLDEYRIHTAFGHSLLYQKRRRRSVPDDQVNWQIRNFDNGFAYAKVIPLEDDLHRRLEVLASHAVNALGLHFGAVDIIHNRRANSLYILEINTAPGLSEGTAEWYASRIREYISQRG